MKIVLAQPLAIDRETLATLSEKVIQMGHELRIYEEDPKDQEELAQRLQEAEIAIVANYPVTAEALKQAAALRYLTIAFTGYDHVAMEECQRRGIQVSNASGYATDGVAELALGMIISLARRLVECDKTVRLGGTKAGLMGWELKGKKIGIVGTGAIGLRLAELLQPFQCRLLGYSRSESEAGKALGIEYMSLDEVLSRADVVSLHVPLNDQTRLLLNQARLEKMQAHALLINTARGPVVDSDALAEALRQGRLAGAAIDVFEKEPPIETDHPLLQAPNVLACPHVAFATEEAMVKRATIVFDNIEAWLQGRPKNLVQ